MTKHEKAKLVKERKRLTEEAFQDLRQNMACLSFHLDELLLSRARQTKTEVVKAVKTDLRRRGPDVSGVLKSLITG